MKNIRFAITAAVAAFALGGCSAAVASSAAHASATQASGTVKTAVSKPAAPPVPPVPTHITVYSVNSDAPELSAVVSGPVLGDWGSADNVQPGSTVPTKHASEILLNLAHGTFRLNVADIGASFTKALGPANIPSTCSDYVSVHGNVPVVPGSGTGAYQGISGTFDATLTVDELHHTPCEPGQTLYRQLLWLNGAGHITLP